MKYTANKWDSNRLDKYRLIRTWEIGNRSLSRIFAKYQDIHLFITNEETWKTECLTDIQISALRQSIQINIQSELDLLENQRIRFILASDPEFPLSLKSIPDSPVAIFCRGSIPNDQLRIAIVGTRKMTTYGKRCTQTFSHALSQANISIVSGLAFGIDIEAHRTALTYHQPLIAVVPGGVDDRSIVPRSHMISAQEIIRAGGCIISEHTANTPTLPFQYLHRNRLIAGLSHAVVVIEADNTSGALTTAKLALEQGKEVLAVPGPIDSSASNGTNNLIKNGAALCAGIDDIWSVLPHTSPEHIRDMTHTRSLLPITPEEQELLVLLRESKTIDDLVILQSQDIRKIHSLLSILEMKGYIRNDEGTYQTIGQ